METEIQRLFKRDNGKCHYCYLTTRLGKESCKHPLYATRDHVIPRAKGGVDGLHNYVLACQRCNNEKSSTLDVCACDFCQDLISKYYEYTFNEMIAGMKPKVKRVSSGYRVYFLKTKKTFETFAEAIDYATKVGVMA